MSKNSEPNESYSMRALAAIGEKLAASKSALGHLLLVVIVWYFMDNE